MMDARVSEKSIALRSLNFLNALGKTLWLPAKNMPCESNGVVGEGGPFRDGELGLLDGIWKPSWRMRVGDELAPCGTKNADMLRDGREGESRRADSGKRGERSSRH